MKTKILIALLKDKRVQIGIAAVIVGIFVPLILLIAAVGSVFAGFSGDGGDRDAAYYQYIVPEIRRVNQLYGTDDRIDERQAYAVYVETIKKDYELTWEIGERFAGCFYTISKESGQDKLKILQLPEILKKSAQGSRWYSWTQTQKPVFSLLQDCFSREAGKTMPAQKQPPPTETNILRGQKKTIILQANC